MLRRQLDEESAVERQMIAECSRYVDDRTALATTGGRRQQMIEMAQILHTLQSNSLASVFKLVDPTLVG